MATKLKNVFLQTVQDIIIRYLKVGIRKSLIVLLYSIDF